MCNTVGKKETKRYLDSGCGLQLSLFPTNQSQVIPTSGFGSLSDCLVLKYRILWACKVRFQSFKHKMVSPGIPSSFLELGNMDAILLR